MGIIKKLFGKKDNTDAELKAKVLQKATDHWNANSELPGSQDPVKDSDKNKAVEKGFSGHQDISQAKKKNIRTVLLEIANRGETGVLSTSISDKVGMNKIDVSTALSYLTKNNFVEAVNSPVGMKYYLTAAGRKYCLSKEFNLDH